jgi:hypothetical protein
MGANELNPLINTPIHGGVGVKREGNRFKRFRFAVLRRGTPINGGVNMRLRLAGLCFSSHQRLRLP